MGRRKKVRLDESGEIDWHANGWPEPNPFAIAKETVDGVEYSTAGMPNDVFDYWENQCNDLDVWEID